MRRSLTVLLVSVASLFATAGAAQAVVVDMGAAGHFGVALVPGTNRATAGIQTITSSAPCSDPWLSSDLGGPVLPSNSGRIAVGVTPRQLDLFQPKEP